MDWGAQQQSALNAVAEWHQSYRHGGPKQIFRLFGYAGTGKTTLARSFAERIPGRTVYAAFTGKAALAMQRSGCRDASTIHSLIYQPVEDEDTGEMTFELSLESDAANAGLIVIDECSMVGDEIGRDLLSYGVPVLVLGDPAQLPPVGNDAGFFTAAKPDAMLTEIHRQAEGNPIIQLATAVRLGKTLDLGQYGSSRVIGRGVLSDDEIMSASQILVGRNATRASFNRRIRGMMGRDGTMPINGDKLVCLKNDKKIGIFNGGIFTVRRRILDNRRPDVRLLLDSDDFPNRDPVMVTCRDECFTGGLEDVTRHIRRHYNEFDYGYALTCHKAQGSQWNDVIVYDESRIFREDWARWLYTAITRASDRVTVVI